MLLPLLLVSLSGLSAPAAAHPLDPLSPDEIERAVGALKAEGRLGPSTLFPLLALKEPPKAAVLASSAPPREAFAVLYDRASNRTFEATVDVAAAKVSSWTERPGAQPAVLLSEFDEAPGLVKADARWLKAIERRGLKPEDVAVDIWAYGAPDSALSRGARLLRAVSYLKGGAKNFYASPIEGLTAIVNMNARKVEAVIDGGSVPVPAPRELLVSTRTREGLKALEPSQPDGPSFETDGREVRWQNWSFRFAMHPREGLVLYQVSYDDHGRRRPILYRASLAEMMVPYGDPDPHWTYRNAFDEGEYGIGRYSGSLEPGADVPSNARLFDATFADDGGKPYVLKNAIALYERDGGLLWKHYDMYAGGSEARRARELVLGFVTTISNYDYGINWIFRQDGTLELSAELTGIMLAKGSAAVPGSAHHGSGDLRYGHLVAPNVVAPHHQHFFNFRLDLDVDGTANRAVELSAAPLGPGPGNPALNAFEMRETPLMTEGGRDLDLASQRRWRIESVERKNALGGPTAYMLIPGDNSVPFLDPAAPPRRRGGFVDHAVWLTPYDESERYAAGPYPSQRATPDGLPVWVARKRPLDGKDVVLWYTFGVTHAPRPEEWPVMTVHRAGFKLIPAGFFDENPALDVPRSASKP